VGNRPVGFLENDLQSCKSLRLREISQLNHIGIADTTIRRLALRRSSRVCERHAASAELRKRIKDALVAGVSPTRIGKEARLSRQAVYEARDQL
jgi:hypothetical protein